MSFAAAHDRHLDPPDPPDWSTIEEDIAEAAMSDAQAAIEALRSAYADGRLVCERAGVSHEDSSTLADIQCALDCLSDYELVKVAKPGGNGAPNALQEIAKCE